MHVIVETERLLLRRFTADDAQELHRLHNDAEVMRYINNGEAVPIEEIVDEDLPAFLGYYARRDVRFLGGDRAIERSVPRLVPLPPAAGRRTARTGARLPPRVRRAWGKGYATEGSKALIDRGFESFGVDRVHASTMAVNVGSRRVMEKCGMRFVRLFHADWPVRIPGDEEGDVEYELSRTDWEAGRGDSAVR